MPSKGEAGRWSQISALICVFVKRKVSANLCLEGREDVREEKNMFAMLTKLEEIQVKRFIEICSPMAHEICSLSVAKLVLRTKLIVTTNFARLSEYISQPKVARFTPVGCIFHPKDIFREWSEQGESNG